MLAVVEAVVMALLALVALAVVVLAEKEIQIQVLVRQTLVGAEVVVMVEQSLKLAVQAVLELSSSLTQAHNNLVVAQSHQAVETQSIHLLLVVY
jgi:hypothetical protein